MCEAFEGSLVHDKERQETGTYPITRSTASDLDPLFGTLPRTFVAVEGHKDHLSLLPPGAVHLAESAQSPIQAFTFPNEPMYALQFHPELDREGMITRINYYRDLYLKSSHEGKGFDAEEAEFERIIQESKPTPEAAVIPRAFFERIVCEGKRYPAE